MKTNYSRVDVLNGLERIVSHDPNATNPMTNYPQPYAGPQMCLYVGSDCTHCLAGQFIFDEGLLSNDELSNYEGEGIQEVIEALISLKGVKFDVDAAQLLNNAQAAADWVAKYGDDHTWRKAAERLNADYGIEFTF